MKLPTLRIPILCLVLALLLPASIGRAEEKTKSRRQAILKVKGAFLDRGGFEVESIDTEGPCANLDLPNAAKPTQGILEKGDIITLIEGKKFQDRREFLDLLNDAYRANKGKVRITVKDVNSGRSTVWVAKPVVVTMEVPVKRSFDFLAELGKPVPVAPPPPKVPPTIDP